MDRQLNLTLKSDAERVAEVTTYLRPVCLAPRLVSAVAVIFGLGDVIQIGCESAIRWAGSKAQADRAAKTFGLTDCSANTFVSACLELEDRRLIGILRTTKPWTYVLSLRALGRLQAPVVDPLEQIAALPIFGGDRGDGRSGPVSVGQGARVRENREIQNPCTVYVDRDTCGGGLADRMRRPWDRHCGLTSEDLQRAVALNELEPLRALWREALVLEWVQPTEDARLRFLTIAHHCATVNGLGNRIAAFVARVKRGLDVGKIRQASELWAAEAIRRRNQDPALAGARGERAVRTASESRRTMED
jgi:hypothetical protein